MKREIPLTPEQRVFAAEHHELVFKFLYDNHLPEDEYYDVVVFGYLKAVRDYMASARMWVYPFTVFGWKSMTQSLHNHNRAQATKKRSAEVTSICDALSNEHGLVTEPISAHNDLMLQLEADLILHDLARHVSQRQMDAVRMRSDGYGIRDIAHRQNATIKEVSALLEEAHRVLRELCYE